MRSALLFHRLHKGLHPAREERMHRVRACMCKHILGMRQTRLIVVGKPCNGECWEYVDMKPSSVQACLNKLHTFRLSLTQASGDRRIPVYNLPSIRQIQDADSRLLADDLRRTRFHKQVGGASCRQKFVHSIHV